MPDAYTPNFSILQPQQGGDVGTWGTLLNNGVMAVLDNILGSNYSTQITSTDVTLTTTQYQNGIFILSGTLTGNRNFILPLQTGAVGTAVGGKFVVVNNTAGAYTLTVKTAAANATSGVAVVPQGQVCNLYSDTINVGYDNSGLPASVPAVSGNPTTQLAGTAGTTNVNASLAYDYTNNQIYICTTSGTAASAIWSTPTVIVPRGFDTPVNLSLAASVSGNLLTVTALSAATGTTPSTASPVIVNFRNATLGTGSPVGVSITTACAISTFTTGASLGASNATPFRFWIAFFYQNATTVAPALINCSNSTRIFPLNESALASTVGMVATSTLAGTFYTPNGVALSASPFRIVGFLSYETGLTTAGTYNNPPTEVQLFGPGIKKPGDIVQQTFSLINTSTAISTTTQTLTGVSATIAPTSAVNLVEVDAVTPIFIVGGNNITAVLQLSRGTGPALIGSKSTQFNNDQPFFSTVPLVAVDALGTTGSTTYALYGTSTAATTTINGPGGAAIKLREIMG